MTHDKKFFVPELKHYNNNINKRWRIEWTIPSPGGGRRCPRPIYGDINKAKTIEERRAIADKIIKGLRLDLPRQKAENLFTKVIDAKRTTWRPKTISAYNTVVISFTGWLKKVKPESVKPSQITAYLNYLQDQGAGRNTIAKYRNTLYTLYNKAKALKLFTGDIPVIKETAIRRSPQSYFFFSDEQIELFRRAEIGSQLWLGIKLLFYCFIRPGEQRHMRISWINFQYQYIEVPAEYSKNGKTQKVSIPDAFIGELRQLQQFPSNYFVLSKSGGPGTVQISTKWLNDEHAKVLDKLQIRGRYAFYSWKHTGVVKAVKAGINIKDLQLQLRHHSLDMVNEYLKNLGVTDSEDLREKFPPLGAIMVSFAHRTGCTCESQPEYNYCPQCGVRLKVA